VEINAEDSVEGSPEATLIVYRTYRRLLEEDTPMTVKPAATDAADPAEAEDDDECLMSEEEQRQRRHEKERMAFVRDLGVCPELMPITWQTFFTWIDRKSDLAEDCRIKSTCQALLRALRDWRQLEASVAQSYLGVSLNMLFQWVWPSAAYSNVARMLTWIGRHEFEKIRQTTPRVISKEDREQLEGIFSALDVHKRGHISAEDLAGGASRDSREAALRNIVDVDTVRAVYGRAPRIRLLQFLEIMCEDNFRGHDEASHVLLEDGRRLVYVSREVTGCHGWLFQDAPRSEEYQRALVDAIELEVSRWQSLGRIQCRSLEPAAMKRGSVVDPTELLPSPTNKPQKTLAGAVKVYGGGYMT